MKSQILFQNNLSTLLIKLRVFLFTAARPLLAIGIALFVGGIWIWIEGANPLTAYDALLKGSIGSLSAIANTGVRTAPLLLTGLGVAVGFKAGLFNVGAEGQLYMGAAAATVVGILDLPLPPFLHLLLALVAGAFGGAFWGFIPGYLRAYRNVSEVVVTLMLNYVGIYFVSYLVHYGPLAEHGASYPQSPPIVLGARLPLLIPRTSLHAGILLGIVLAVLLFLFLQYSPFGFKTRLVGSNQEAARYAGIAVKRQLLLVMMLSGALAGLGGAGEILGLKWRLFDFFIVGLGYDAIAVALLANSNPLGVILSACFFGALRAGANNMQQVTGIETSLATVIQALAVLFVIGIGFARRRTTRKKNRPVEGKEEIAPQI